MSKNVELIVRFSASVPDECEVDSLITHIDLHSISLSYIANGKVVYLTKHPVLEYETIGVDVHT